MSERHWERVREGEKERGKVRWVEEERECVCERERVCVCERETETERGRDTEYSQTHYRDFCLRCFSADQSIFRLVFFFLCQRTQKSLNITSGYVLKLN